MKTPSDQQIIAAMKFYGGSFVSRLAAAAEHADYDNLARLKTAFPHYWNKYGKMAAIRENNEKPQ